jgi:hypothetical protein
MNPRVGTRAAGGGGEVQVARHAGEEWWRAAAGKCRLRAGGDRAFVRADRPNFMPASATVDLSTVNSTHGRHPTRPRRHTGAMRRALPMACLLALFPSTAAAAAASEPGAAEYQPRHVCAPPAPGHATCLALELVPRTGSAPLRARPPLGQPLALPPETRVAPLAPSPASPPGTGAGQAKPLAAPRGTAVGPGYAAGVTPEPVFPKELLSAYDLPAEPPPGSPAQTVALVDAYNDLNAEADLNIYDSAPSVDLSACNQKNGCFRKVDQGGGSAEEGASGTPFPRSAKELKERETTCTKTKQQAACTEVEEAAGWTVEISTDIDVVHSICQGCHILLVEANTPAFNDLEAAEDTAVRLGATEVSNSWGGSEPVNDSDSPAFDHPKTVITAAAGDDGYLNWTEAEAAQAGYFAGADYPASSPHVVAVGGTELTLTKSGARQSETAWNEDPDPEGGDEGAGGGGCSASFAAPEWQQNVPDWASVGCGTGTEAKRAVADVAADADPYSGVVVYDSEASKEYLIVIGGTSVASPIIASTFALAGGSDEVEYPAQTLYSHLGEPSLYDVTEGGNGECDDLYTGGCSGSMDPLSPLDCGAGVLICNAAPGYDGPTGVGTPDGIAAFAPGSEAEQLARAEEAKREAERQQAEEARKAEEELKVREKRAAEERLSAEATLRAEEAKRAEEARKDEEALEAAEEVLRAAEEASREEAGASSRGTTLSQSAGAGRTSAQAVLTEAGLDEESSQTKSRGSSSGGATVRLTHLVLTARASAALSRGRPALSHVAFAFTLSAAARVRVTLSRQVRVRGRLRWVQVARTLTLTASGGRHRAHLRGRRALASGHYRLTAAPAHGAARTLAFSVG